MTPQPSGRQDVETTAGKPDSPRDIAKPEWRYILRKTFREFSRDHCTDLAAALTYYGVLSLFPALLALVSLLGVFGDSAETTDKLLEVVRQVAPGAAVEVMQEPIRQLADARTAGFALVIGIAGALWSASGYVGAFSRALNRIYEIEEGRPFWKLRPLVLGITVVMLVAAVVVAIAVTLSGPVAEGVGSVFGLGGAALAVWEIAKWPLMAAVAVFLIALLYYAAPNVKQPRFRWISLGALIALAVLTLASVGFALYVANFSNYNKTYGAIGGVIVLLLWLYLANLSLLFGAEFDAELERGRQLQAGIKAEEELQLPPRDTRQIDKKEHQEQDEIAHGRSLRERHGHHGRGSQENGPTAVHKPRRK